MTNWMTAAGIALIAGGLATLICFRAVLFRRGRRRARGGARPAVEVSRPRRGSRRRPAAVGGQPARRSGRGRGVGGDPDGPAVDDDLHGGLVSLGLADDEDELDDPMADPVDVADERPDAVVPLDACPDAYPELAGDAEDVSPQAEPADEAEPDFGAEHESGAEAEPAFAAAEPPAPQQRYGHRVAGWVRPEYHDVREEPPAGEYWTPIPVDLAGDHEPSAKGYGWPVPVERLPPVPSYEPATGFDLEPVPSEPTEALSSWTHRAADERPGRIRLPRSWATRDDARATGPVWPPLNESAAGQESTQLFAAVPKEPRRRPRPRPRPEPPADRNTTVYVSRHAAEPPR